MFGTIKMTREEFKKLEKEFNHVCKEFKTEMNAIQDGTGSETKKAELGRRIIELSDKMARAVI